MWWYRALFFLRENWRNVLFYSLQRLNRNRLANPPTVGQVRGVAHRAGVRPASSDIVRRLSPGSTAWRYSFTGTSRLRQDSTTERIAATFGPAFALPTCNQFLRPTGTGRIEFSARLFDNSTSPWSKQ